MVYMILICRNIITIFIYAIDCNVISIPLALRNLLSANYKMYCLFV